uniref:DUF659 domain-containing protein n=1 Tax=Strongyloides papillosus TaxID=174720 RepID=A0A0N5BMS3_STREA
MVWGGISASGKTPLLFIDKNMKINSKVYQEEILKKAVDWASAHKAKTTIQFLETKIGSFLTKDLWPTNSPNLNPLDFSVWGFMEEQLRSRNIKNLVTLRRELTKIWNNLDVNYLRRTIDSIKKRINACIKADGDHFEKFL